MKKPSDSTQHQQKMSKVKLQIDRQIAKADKDQGVCVLLTGNGKGKSSSAFGMLARSLGYGHNCAVVQFIKGDWECGEELFFSQHPKVSYHAMGAGFTWETQNQSADQAAAEKAWGLAASLLADSKIDFLILDELTYMFSHGWLDLDKVIQAIQNRPSQMNLVITGRGAPEGLITACDTVSHIKDIKHAFRSGIKAQRGIEF
ncbi:MAG: cob(I)yrinic acid a,c-diamide adenosyltransferase [Gammaproteobacteria bacterium]|nr:cob(I)yrinic acid a,c-diamide adenosyltransferase [Gammaproteobacteria bacterium]